MLRLLLEFVSLFVFAFEVVDCDDPTTVENALHIGYDALSLICMIVGLIVCFTGYRLFRPILFITGLGVGGGIVYVVLKSYTGLSELLILGIAVGVGIACAIFLLYIVHVGIFILGAGFGILIVVLLMGLEDGGLFPQTIQFTLLVSSALIGGVIALVLQKVVIVGATSFGGAYMVIAGLDHFSRAGFSKVILHMVENHNERITAPFNAYVEIGACIALFLIGIYVQFNYTGQKVDHRPKRRGDYSQIQNTD